ncbi:fibrinogen-like protein A isoform X1 [Apostichopus japonicus]|uniref:fibrinogen-like protein A isoform X1 n=1 Tax=Stichopus japonicus TaxID=307972 RepID=UPI003AB38311
METKSLFQFFLLSVVFLDISLAECNKLCEFWKKFPNRTSCYRQKTNENNRSDSTVPTESSEQSIENNAGATESLYPGSDCFYPIDNVNLSNGSFSANANCTTMYNCTHGIMSVDVEYNCSANAVCETRNGVRRCYCSNGYQGNGVVCTFMTNCHDYFKEGFTTNGIYTIKPTNWNGQPFAVFCNMTEGGGWTVFQRRVNGSVDFYRNWTSYKEGFGELSHEFWLGNDKIYYLTNQGNCQLRIDLVSKYGAPYYANYDLFRINDESDKYRLSGVGKFSGTADAPGNYTGFQVLKYNLKVPFSTFDKDSDKYQDGNCAIKHHGAWWYKSCSRAHLNADYYAANDSNSSIRWWELPRSQFNIKYVEMKVRPV